MQQPSLTAHSSSGSTSKSIVIQGTLSAREQDIAAKVERSLQKQDESESLLQSQATGQETAPKSSKRLKRPAPVMKRPAGSMKRPAAIVK